MKQTCFPSKSRIQVTNYGPFRGLKGTVQNVDVIIDELNGFLCFYLVSLEGTHFREPIWFEHNELEFIDFSPSASQLQAELA